MVADPAAKPNAKAEAEAERKAETTSASTPKSAAELKTEATPANGLKLSFAQAAWVEVRDGRGEVVAFGVKPAGSQQEIKGQPPFSLVLGNAKYVAVEYQGKPVELEPHISKGVARLSIK